MNTSDIDKLIPILDRTKLSAGEYAFMQDQIALLRKTLETQFYGVVAGYDEFWRERDDCDLESKFRSMGTSLRTFFTCHTINQEGLNQLAKAANMVLPKSCKIQLLEMRAPGVITFKKDGSFESWTPTPPEQKEKTQ